MHFEIESKPSDAPSRSPELPAQIHIDNAILSQHASSALLRVEPQPEINNHINTVTTETYGDPLAPLGFRLGNGGAGYTGILRVLCEAFLRSKIREGAAAFRIEWCANHSRHTQIALLGNIVQVALTYEPDWEDQTIQEGWASRVTRVFNDRFVLVGPKDDPAGVAKIVDQSGHNDDLVICLALREIAAYARRGKKVVTHFRGDGSATSYKEMQLWGMTGVDLAQSHSWRQRVPRPPYEALKEGDRAGVYIITDRATFLTAKRDGIVPDIRAFVQKGRYLLNPCSALVNTKVVGDARSAMAVEFAQWLAGENAQTIVRDFGKDWKTGLPLFAQGSVDGCPSSLEGVE